MLLGLGVRRSFFGATGAGLGVLLVSSVAGAAPTTSLTNPLEPIGEAECNYCHRFGNDAAHEDEPLFAPYTTWQGSLMANAARDPVFWAGVAVAADDATTKGSPEETEVCIRCHSPRAFFQGRADATSPDDLLPDDFEGVTCDLCHRMQDDGIIGNAQYTVDDVLVGGNVPRRGPWDYTDGVPLPQEHSTLADPFTGSSELCGVCHDVTTNSPRVDDSGNEIAPNFPEQRTYSEWSNSAFAVPGDDFRSCQDCHMPEVPDSAACNTYVGKYSHPTGNRRHDLIGANKFMLQILLDNFGIEIGLDALDASIARVDDFVQTSATLEVTGPDSVDVTAGLGGLDVTVTNETGHKLPSGYSEGRVMWLEVTASYGDDVVFSSGAWDQKAGTIEEDDQLRTYEGLADEYTSGETFHLLLNDHWIEDTRIPPRGLTVDLETDPVTDRYAMQGDGTWEHWDAHSYVFAGRDDVVDATPGDATDDELSIQVRLLYLINTPEYIDFLEQGSVAGVEVAAMFDEAGGATPIVFAEQTLTVPLTGLAAPGTSSSSSGAPPDTDSQGSSSTGGSVTTGVTSPSTTVDPTAATTATDTDTTGPGGDDDGGGCSCTTSPGSGPFAVFGLLGILGLKRRRRRSFPRRR